MHYIIQLLAAILIGISVGGVFGSRHNNPFLIGYLIALAIGIAAIATISWILLAIGTAVFLVVHAMQRDVAPARA